MCRCFIVGFVFPLPSLTIEVAKQCSGIRSNLALLLSTLLVGEFVYARFGGSLSWFSVLCLFLF